MAFVLLLLLCSFFGINAIENTGSFNILQANISVWLSAAASCGKDYYKSHVFKGPTEGFIVTSVIDNFRDTEGYIGYLPSDKSIYVVFRGSISIRNWLTDLDAFKTPYLTFPECECEVHQGFYNSVQSVIKMIIFEVKKLQLLLPSDYVVKVTGHSLGGALAQLTGMEIIHAGIPTSVYNFGQPRVGDKSYASFATKTLQIFRVTHNKDIVPHVPVIDVMGFYHSCTEVFEDVSGSLRVCSDSSCEDPTCADQYKLVQTDTADHVVYLGLPMNCENVSR